VDRSKDRLLGGQFSTYADFSANGSLDGSANSGAANSGGHWVILCNLIS
jgi:hypothetical protein